MTSIHARSRQGLAINFGAQITKFVLQFASSVILARLLVPADFGVVAMASPLLAFVQLFADLGLTQATVLRQNITQGELTFIFWANVATSAAVAVILIALSPLAGIFYHDVRVVPVVAAFGVPIAINGLYAQQSALLNRGLRFGALVAVDLGGFASGATAGIVAAMAGWSYWAIVFNQIVAVTCAMVIAWSLSRWRPSRPRMVESWGELLSIGGNVTGFNLVNYFARNADNVLIGRVLGAVSLGLYDRAYKLLLLPLNQITGPIAKVATPMLARTLEYPDKYRRAYLRLLETVVLLSYPGVIVVGVASGPFITTVLGQRWAGAAPVFQVLAIGGLFAPIGNSTGWLFLTQNRTREMRNCGLVSSTAYVCSFIVGLPWGIEGVAIAYIATGTALGPWVWWIATRTGPVSFKALISAMIPYWISACPVGIATALAMHLSSGWTFLGVLMGGGYAVFVASMLFLPRGRAALSEVKTEVSALLGRK